MKYCRIRSFWGCYEQYWPRDEPWQSDEKKAPLDSEGEVEESDEFRNKLRHGAEWSLEIWETLLSCSFDLCVASLLCMCMVLWSLFQRSFASDAASSRFDNGKADRGGLGDKVKASIAEYLDYQRPIRRYSLWSSSLLCMAL